MYHDFSNRVAVVTGGGRGVGRVIAHRLVASGAHVIVNYCHDRASAEDTVEQLTEQGPGQAHLVRASVARHDEVADMFEQVREWYGRVDVLVNNAASGAFRPLGRLRERDWNRALDTNVKGALWCSQHAVPLMPAADTEPGGAIVNLSSTGAQAAMADYACVGTAKAATEALTRYLALEYGRLGVRANTASAGPIDGETLRRLPAAATMLDRARDITPLGRLGTADDLAHVVLFLASPAARWITGQTLVADGGLTVAGPFAGAATANSPEVARAPAAGTPGAADRVDVHVAVGG
ncbi:SDR family oxidoreductase [Lipingzhangella sp. LS1_29]|uniref:SDR family oxidoreductase n=1 Tax=Lipingzhangella rawalii TaxID=2055835 RepID=A0ABU2H1Q1_9ACTN|nr:SDR family oxidoreductase [Lipingzhangella rawalii]MDS1269232.1 SDR family oxidoreductase [Lipingzhangella rawalii]